MFHSRRQWMPFARTARVAFWALLPVVAVAALGLCADLRPARAEDPPEPRTGVEVVGRSEDDRRPQYFKLVDKKTGSEAARVQGKWGFAPTAPGLYVLHVRPAGHQAIEIAWGEVAVVEGKTTRVPLDSGIEVVPPNPETPEFDHWRVVDAKSEKPVAYVWNHWGFAPLPPGEYRLVLRPKGHGAMDLPWGDVKVEPARVTTVAVVSGIDVQGRGPDDEPPEWWIVHDAKTESPVAKVWRAWGFTPLRPGAYTLRLVPQGHQAVEIPWAAVTVEEGKTLRVDMGSGIELKGRSAEDEAPEFWYVYDAATNAPVARTWQRWGFTPVKPGTYRVSLLPTGSHAIEVPWGEVTVAEGGTTSVSVDSGVEVEAGAEEKPPEFWEALDLKTRKPLAHVWRRWGFTPLPPGEYEIVCPPLRLPTARVGPHEVVRLSPPDLEGRLKRVTGAGRPTEKERDPEGYRRLEEEIERAIRRGAAWLKRHELLQEMDPKHHRGEPTIGILALVHAGELERDRALAARATDYLLRRTLNGDYATYATSLTAMALRDHAALRLRSRTFECAQWLVENQGWDDTSLGWAYGKPVPGFDAKPAGGARPVAPPGAKELEVVRRGLLPKADGWDNSNIQFAVLGLHAAAQSRIRLPRESWERVERHFRAQQSGEGAWGYSGGAYGSMTCAGVASLLIARHHLGADRPSLDPAVVKGLEWLDWNFTVEENPKANGDHYYFLYGLERVGVLAGTEFLGQNEWYPMGARHLLAAQRDDGAWTSKKGPTGSPHDYLDTCYAILFLRRATLPLESTLPATLRVTHEDGALPLALSPAVELILDASGSMKEPIDGKPKMAIARAVVTEVLDGLASDIRVGFRLYGHWGVWLSRKDDPKAGPLDPNDPRLKRDTQLVVPIARLDDAQRARIRKWINFAEPRGWTPMVLSLLEAKNDFPSGDDAPRMVVLVSDGEETGGGKLEDVAAAYRDSGIEVKIHVVGFDIEGTPAQRQLAEIARLGKGRYFGARNARELGDALRAVVPTLGFEVHDAGGETLVAQGTLGGDPVELKPGGYRVRLVGVPGEPLAVTLEEGQELHLTRKASGALVPAGP